MLWGGTRGPDILAGVPGGVAGMQLGHLEMLNPSNQRVKE